MKEEHEKIMEVATFEDLMQTVGNIHENRKGVSMEFTDEITARIQIWTEGPTIFSLYVERPVKDFLRELTIRSWEDVEAIGEEILWEQFGRGNGHVFADLDFMCAGGLMFRVEGNKTLIEWDMVVYNDKVDGVLGDLTAFRDYVRDHIRELYVAAELARMS